MEAMKAISCEKCGHSNTDVATFIAGQILKCSVNLCTKCSRELNMVGYKWALEWQFKFLSWLNKEDDIKLFLSTISDDLKK